MNQDSRESGVIDISIIPEGVFTPLVIYVNFGITAW